MNASNLFAGGTVVTVDKRFSTAEAVLVEGERIVAVGATRDLRKLAPAGTTEIDLAGRTLLPGFIDTHGHLGLFGLDELKVSLDGAATKDAILDRLRQRVKQTPAGGWVVAMPVGDAPYFLQADALRARGVVPTRQELDALAPDHPLYIQAPTNRVPNFAVLNSAALKAAGITGQSRISQNSHVELAGGSPTGILFGALQPLYNADPLYQM
ncbi:MAG: amidohydrolase family protein, partial [Gammaproteobacteria bacterium]